MALPSFGSIFNPNNGRHENISQQQNQGFITKEINNCHKFTNTLINEESIQGNSDMLFIMFQLKTIIKILTYLGIPCKFYSSVILE